MSTDYVLEAVEKRRLDVLDALPKERRAELGQVFTPEPVARFLASMFALRDEPARLLDPGAGAGALTAAFVDQWVSKFSSPLSVTACEIDSALGGELGNTLARCNEHENVSSQLLAENFIHWGADQVSGLTTEPLATFTHIIMNPPYRKLAARASEREMARQVGSDAPNLYAAFLGVAARLLCDGGQLVAIVPRSFTNGPYFKTFRRDLLGRVAFRRIHVYDSRNSAFADSQVLQENVVFMAERTTSRRAVTVSSSSTPDSRTITRRNVPYAQVVRPDDPESFIHLAPILEHANIASLVSGQPNRVADLAVTVSTGRVVDFRSREHLRSDPEPGSVPLLYPTHLNAGRVTWPKVGKKPNALSDNDQTRKMFLPAGCYVLVKRFSAKEERRRLVAAFVEPGDLPGDRWAFENHLNVLHCCGAGMDRPLALGLAVWLNSTPVDIAFRQFSGHTQVNATDLRSMGFPALDDLLSLGQAAGTPWLSQEKTDELVEQHVDGFGA